MWWVIKVFCLGEMFSHCGFEVYQSFAKSANKSFPPLCFQQLWSFYSQKIVESFLSKVGTCCLLSKNIFVSQSTEVKHLNLIILKMSQFLYLYFLEPAFRNSFYLSYLCHDHFSSLYTVPKFNSKNLYQWKIISLCEVKHAKE